MEQNPSWFRRHKILTALCVVLAFFFTLAVLGPKKQEEVSEVPEQVLQTPQLGTGIQLPEWDAVRTNDPPRIVSGGWSSPLRLGASEDGMWEDSLFITLDGSRIYFIYYPGDVITDGQKGQYKTNMTTYFSDKPFAVKVRDGRPYFNEQYWSPAGQSITADGEMLYHNNKPIEGDNGRYLPHIYRNEELLPFNNPDIAYNNPQYCSGKDELWFDNEDKMIYFLKNAKASGFKGTPILAPKPINSYNPAINEHQPWLSDDCNTMYFSSTRDNIGSGPFIYISERIGEDTWSAPKLVIKSNIGVGEATLTPDMKQLFFLQVLKNSKGELTTNLFSTQRQ